MTAKRWDYEELPDEELSPELDAKVRAMIVEADQEDADARVNFRWGKPQVDTVKQAADLMGIPYHNYIKQVVYRQAIADLHAALGVVAPSARHP